MTDESSSKSTFSGEIAKELINIAKELWDKRSVERRKVIEKKIDPLFQEMKLAHKDFSKTIDQLEDVIRASEDFLSLKPNDYISFLNSQIEELRGTRRFLNNNRDKRRELFSKSRAFREDLGDHLRANNIIFSQQEIERLSYFYEKLETYFSVSMSEYSHDLGSLIVSTERLMRAYLRDKRDHSHFLDDLKFLEQRFEEYRKNREEIWLEISYAYAKVIS